MRTSTCVFVAFLMLPLAAHAYDVEVIQDNGDPAKRFDIVVLGDGYRDVDQTKLTNDTNWFLDDFWQATPYGEYRNFFNVKLVHVISNEDGADNGMYGYGVMRDTALGAYFWCSNIERLLCVNTGTVLSVAASHVPEYDSIFVMVNDTKYGGAGYSNGIATFSVHSLAPDIAKHEFGHSFGHLADEYEDAYPGYPPCGAECPEPNVTPVTIREDIKWNIWILASTPVPTPETSGYANVVGLFEGARYMSTGVYRPRLNCMMRSLGPAFCEICAEAMVLSAYNVVDPIDSTSPTSPVNLTACDSQELSVTYPLPIPDTMVVTWRVDGQVEATGVSTYTVEAMTLGDGTFSVSAEVADATSLVRNDPSQLLIDEYTWTVNVTGAGQGACLIDAVCYSDGTVNPANPCQECDPVSSQVSWTNDDSLDCDDGVFCNGVAACQAGTCTANGAPCSDDGLTCTTTCDEPTQTCNLIDPGFCVIGGNCETDGTINPTNPCLECLAAIDNTSWSPDDSNACEDGIFCNGAETCQSGTCTNGAAPCTDDGLACTTTCDESGQQCNLVDPGYCVIDGACVAEGTVNPSNPCQECLPASSTSAWSADDTNSCDDTTFCNGAETCSGGVCTTGSEPCNDDGLACTTTCDEQGLACNVIDTGFCVIDATCVADGTADPANPCRECQAAQNATAWMPDDTNSCDDTTFCNGPESCLNGTCTNGTAPCADDGLACTTTCDEGQQACNLLDSSACLIAGACYTNGDPNPDNPCQTCQPSTAQNTWTNDDSRACDDGNDCTDPDQCQAGVCVGTPVANCCSGPEDCSDGRNCTDDVCNQADGTCSNPVSADWCLIGGTCQAEGAANPANACQVCSHQSDSTNWTGIPDGSACDDGLFCSAGETCQSGICSGGSANDCDDGLACTDGVCNEVDDQCDVSIAAGWCQIDSACHQDGAANPANPCTRCDSGSDPSGWTNDDTAACTDGDECTEGDVCSAGECQPGTRVCSDICPCGDGGTDDGGVDPDEKIAGGCSCHALGGTTRFGGWIALIGLLWFGTRRRKPA